MHGILVRRSEPLSGTVRVAGAKNSVLKLMAAATLAPGRYELINVPGISDVATMSELLGATGVRTTFDPARPDRLELEVGDDLHPVIPAELAERIRASTAVIGPLLARCGEVRMATPGGDDFGGRPIDLHLRGLEALGAQFELRDGALVGTVDDGLRGTDVTLDFPSVGATENIVMAAVLAKGTTVLDNAAREPEIADLCHFLAAMGAQIEGVGTSTLVVHGVPTDELHGVSHRVVPDRVEAATYLAAVGLAGGDVTVLDARPDHMEMVLCKLRAMGLHLEPVPSGLRAVAGDRLRAVDVATLPYPGVATDYKPLVTTLLSVAEGVGIVTENLFAGRFRYVEQLVRLGADIRTDAHHAIVRGVPKLVGVPVRATDIRAGAALVVAGLAAEGETFVEGVAHVDRGYEDLVGKLASLGAPIERVGERD